MNKKARDIKNPSGFKNKSFTESILSCCRNILYVTSCPDSAFKKSSCYMSTDKQRPVLSYTLPLVNSYILTINGQLSILISKLVTDRFADAALLLFTVLSISLLVEGAVTKLEIARNAELMKTGASG